MASWFTKLVDRVTPWDRGGEAQRRQEEEERRRREAEARAQVQPPRQFQNQGDQRSAPITIVQPDIQNSPLNVVNDPRNANQEFARKQEQENKLVNNVYQAISKGNSPAPYSPQIIERASNKIKADAEQAKAERIAKQSTGDKVKNVGKSLWLGSARFGASVPQALGGLYDLATPGEGTNRVSDFGNKYAESLDRQARDGTYGDLNTKIYHGMQIGSELISGAGAGALAKQVASRIPQAAKLSTKLDDAINLIPGGGKMGNFARKSAQELVDPANIGAETYFANKFIAEDAARGNDISPGRIAAEYGLAVPGAAGSVLLGRGLNRLFGRSGDNIPSGANPITEPPKTPNKVEIAPGVKIDAPVDVPPPPSPQLQVDIAGARYNQPTIGQAIDAPSEVPPALFDADARALNNPAPLLEDPLDVPTYQRRNADVDIREAADRLVALNNRSDAIRKAVIPEGDDPVRVAEFERRRAGQEYNPVKVDASKKLVDRKQDVTEKALVDTVAEQRQAQNDLTQAIKARSAQEALQEGGPVVEKPAPVAQAEVEVATMPPTLPVDNSGVETPPVRPDMPGEGAVVTQDVPVQKSKPVPRTPQSELPETSTSGLAKTGEVGKSKGKYAKGQEYDQTSQAASRAQGSEAASTTSYEKFTADVESKGSVDVKDRDTAIELQKRYKAGSPEHRKLGDIANKVDTMGGQILGTIERTIRRTADSKQLTDRFANKLYSKVDDGTVVSKADFDKVEAKNNAFTEARDSYNQSLETFNTDPSQANANAFVKAQKAMEEADRAAKFTEYDVAANIAKNSKNPNAKDFIKQLEQDAGVYTMDMADSSMLSSTRVMLNNYLNTYGVGAEERLFGKVGARIARALTGEAVGGGSRAGRKLGQKLGWKSTKIDAGLRANAQGNKLTKAIKNFTTTGNTLGERNIQGATYAGVYDHYNQILKKAGYKGDELKRRTLVNTLSDPDGIVEEYMQTALRNNALASTSTGKNRIKLETAATNKLSEIMGDSTVAKNVAKALVRVGLGFPTVIVRSAQGGLRRATLGGYTALFKITPNMIKGGDKAVRAALIKDAIKEAGSGATMMAVGGALGAQGLITGAYPTDKDEQEAWKREGKSDHSIKIGSDWYNIPSALGVFAMPFMIGAQAGQNVSEGKAVTDDAVQNVIKTVINSTPVESLAALPNLLTDFERGKDVSKQLVQMGSSLTRTATPLGALVNQVSKMFDPTANDTTKGEAMEQFLAKVQDGVPGLSNKLPAREVEGREVVNPSAISKLFGAVSTEQSGGVQQSEQIRQQIDESVSKLNEYGALSEGVRNLLDDEKKSLLDKAKNGEKLDESDIKGLMDSMVKGVSPTGDNQFLEKEQYDDNLAVLKTKRDILSADPTTTQATLDDYDTQIKRGEIYKKNKTPYGLVKDYKDVGLEDWREMGIPPGDKNHDPDVYNPELYETLWQLDKEMAEAGVSRGKKGKAKYYLKESKAGSRAGSGRKAGARSASFRQLPSNLLEGSGTKANKYMAIDRPKSYIPDLQLDNKAKTSLKKSITVKKGVSYV